MNRELQLMGWALAIALIWFMVTGVIASVLTTEREDYKPDTLIAFHTF
jgi:hypothetical protein